ncbi:MAG TPA: response regulator transcription factor [Ferrovibrio sp.]|uniref:winged helix-turn-helix transcriptional regulator n=1 Tax=Ferrovibrio sp. TaxID=1917215 RepID=UPI002ED19723
MPDPASSFSRAASPRLLYIGAADERAALRRYILEMAGFGVITMTAAQLRPDRLRSDRQLAEAVDIVLLDGPAAMVMQRDRLQALLALQQPVVVLTDAAWPAEDRRILQARGFVLLPRMTPPADLIAALRTNLPGRDRAGERLGFADIELDLVSCRVFRAGDEIHLGPIEFRLLSLFLHDPHRVFSRQQLAAAGWPGNIYVRPRTVDAHVAHLRRRLNAGRPAPLIRTVRGIGYAFS